MDMKQEAVKDAARTIKEIAGIGYQNARRFVTEDGRDDLIPHGNTRTRLDLPFDVHPLGQFDTWADALRAVSDDMTDLDSPATPTVVRILLETLHGGSHGRLNGDILTVDGQLTVNVNQYDVATVGGIDYDTGLSHDCPNPRRVADALIATLQTGVQRRQVWTVDIHSKYGVETTVHETEAGAKQEVVSYMQEYWEQAEIRYSTNRRYMNAEGVVWPEVDDEDADEPFVTLDQMTFEDATSLYFAVMEEGYEISQETVN